MQALPAAAESLCIVEMGGGDEEGGRGTLYLNIGLTNGVLLRTVLDPVTGDLSDTRTRYLGSRPVKLFRIKMQGNQAVSSCTIVLTNTLFLETLCECFEEKSCKVIFLQWTLSLMILEKTKTRLSIQCSLVRC